MSQQKIVKLTWEQVDMYCKFLAEKVRDSYSNRREFRHSRWVPNVIVSIGRGGMIPARMLSDHLELKDVHLFGIKLYKDVGEKLENPVIENFDICVEGKDVLLVDDLVDSGETMEILIKEMTDRGAKNVATAVLLAKNIDKPYDVDYYASRFQKDEWIVFPWELHEFKVVEKETKACLA
jgi:hypoxanthine phosphoribosyltransferase